MGGWQSLSPFFPFHIYSVLNDTTPVRHTRGAGVCIVRSFCTSGWPILPPLEDRGLEFRFFPWPTDEFAI
jgi:hypothetical protein